MGKEPIRIETTDDEPITSGAVLRWGAFVGALILAMVSGVVWATTASNKTEQNTHDVATLRTDVDGVKANVEGVKAAQHEQDRHITDVEKNLDRAILILERIDRKVGP